MSQTKNLSYLESLKGIAILIIIMMHCGSSTLPGFLGTIGGDLGTMGVSIFMLISGVLAFISYSHANQSSVSVSKWYIKKYIRLLPLFLIAMLLCMLTGTYSLYWLGTEQGVSFWNILSHIFFLHGLFPHYCNSILSVEWYLGALALFYLITPLLFGLIRSIDTAIIALIVSIIACPLLNSVVYKLMPVANDPVIYDAYKNTFGPLRILPVYILGITLYFAVDYLKSSTFNSKKLSYALIVFALIMIVGQFTGSNTLFHFSSYLMYGLWFSIIIIGLTLCNNIIFDNPVWRIIGRYSYPMYLFQYLFIFLFERYLAKYDFFIIKFVTVSIVLFVTSIIITKFIDEPVQKQLKQVLHL